MIVFDSFISLLNSGLGITIGLVFNFVIVLTFKILILRWTLKIGPMMPISILIMVDEFEKMIATFLLTSLWIFASVTGKNLIEEMESSSCTVRFIGLFCFLPIFYGGLA